MADHPVPASAVELTDEEIQERAQTMYALDQQIRAGLNKGREGLWDAAAAMHQFDEQNGWSALGYESVRDYCADPEIGVSRATFYRMVRAYDETVVRRQIDFDRVKQLDRSKVDIVLAKVQSGEKKIDDALDDAQSLGFRDLRDLYWGPKPEDDNGAGDGLNAETQDDETGVVSGLDDEPIHEDDGWVDVEAEEVPLEGNEEVVETAPQFIYGEVLFQQVDEALASCRQALDSPSDLLRRVALEKSITVLEAVRNASG